MDDVEYGPESIGPDGIRERKLLLFGRRRQASFVMVPLTWIERLSAAKHRATWAIALELLRRDFKRTGKPIPLPSGQLETKFRINRTRKREALLELERLDLVRVERRRGRSPTVTVVHKP
jgi:hypothetical protein